MGLSDGAAWEGENGKFYIPVGNKTDDEVKKIVEDMKESFNKPKQILVNIADTVNEKTGKTWREENLEKEHNIPLKTLVEVEGSGLRMYVVKHMRDCDGTPLYGLSADYNWGEINNGEVFKYNETGDREKDMDLHLKYVCSLMEKGALDGGYGEDSLTVIKTAEETAMDFE